MNQMINSFAKSHYLQTATLKRTKRAKENMYLALLIQGGLRTIGTEEHLRLLKVGRVQMRDLGMCKKNQSKFCYHVIRFTISDENCTFRLPHFCDSHS